jgi:hypothetical protein
LAFTAIYAVCALVIPGIVGLVAYAAFGWDFQRTMVSTLIIISFSPALVRWIGEKILGRV